MADDDASWEALQRRLRALRPDQNGGDTSGPAGGTGPGLGAAPTVPDFNMFVSEPPVAAAESRRRVQPRARSPGHEERREQQIRKRQQARDQIRSEMLQSMKKQESTASPILGFAAAFAVVCLVGYLLFNYWPQSGFRI